MESETKTGLHTGLGILSLVIGIMALLFSFLPCIGSLALYVALVGLISGIAGYITAKQSNQASGLSLGGTFISGAATIISLWQAHNVSTATSALANLGQTANDLLKGSGRNQMPPPAQAPVTMPVSSEDAIVIVCILAFCVFIFFLYRAIAGKQKDKTDTAENDMAKSSMSYGSSLVLRDILMVFGILLVGGLMFGGYWLFLRHDPVADAKKAVGMLCDCSTASSERRLRRYKDFLSSFETYHFKSQGEARDKIQLTVTRDDDTLMACLTQENNARTNLRTNYIADPVKQQQFDQAFSQLVSTCNDPFLLQINEVKNEVDKKIALLKSPEPGEAEIKNDLIGRNIPNWRFAYLSEFKSFSIDSVARSGKRIEYLITMRLQDEQTQMLQGDRVLVTYEKEEQGWYLLDVKALVMSYRNHALVNQWTQVALLPNCRYAIDGHGFHYWLKDGPYGQQQMGGPEITEPLQINTNEAYIMSREDHDVDIDFLYYPKQ